MQLTKSEAGLIIERRISALKEMLHRTVFILLIITVVVAGVGLIGMFATENETFTLYNINTTGILKHAAHEIYLNGETLSPSDYVGNPVYVLMFVFGAGISVAFIIALTSIKPKAYKLALAQWEKDGTLPPVPVKKEKKK